MIVSQLIKNVLFYLNLHRLDNITCPQAEYEKLNMLNVKQSVYLHKINCHSTTYINVVSQWFSHLVNLAKAA